MRKKAQLELPAIIPLFLSIGGMILVFLIVFLLMSSFGGCGNRDQQSIPGKVSKDIEAGYALLQYLRTPVEVDGVGVNFADLIYLVEEENDCFFPARNGKYCDLLWRRTNEYFDKLYSDVPGEKNWHLEVVFVENDRTGVEVTFGDRFKPVRGTADTLIPFPDASKEAIVSFTVRGS